MLVEPLIRATFVSKCLLKATEGKSRNTADSAQSIQGTAVFGGLFVVKTDKN